jgi:hypothetical protein
MSNRAEGTFALTSWDEGTYAELDTGGKMTRATITQDFIGDLEGACSWESLMCYRADGTADYIGLARMTGRLGQRSGSFVLQTSGTFDGNEAKTDWEVVPGSGSGELTGLRGRGSAAAPHGPNGSYTLEYDLD